MTNFDDFRFLALFSTFPSKFYRQNFFTHTKSQMYGTEMRANPAEKFVIPMARVRRVGGYWNDVNAGIIAFATPVVLLPKLSRKFLYFFC